MSGVRERRKPRNIMHAHMRAAPLRFLAASSVPPFPSSSSRKTGEQAERGVLKMHAHWCRILADAGSGEEERWETLSKVVLSVCAYTHCKLKEHESVTDVSLCQHETCRICHLRHDCCILISKYHHCPIESRQRDGDAFPCQEDNNDVSSIQCARSPCN